MHIKQFLLLAFSLVYTVVSQAETYEWVDDKGVKNYGDSVPAKYKHKANTIEIKENVIAAPIVPKVNNANKNQADNPEQAKPVVLEAPAPNNLTDESCEVQMQQYKESQDCFARYRNVRGGINEEGVKRCTAVQQPACNTSR
ncbi:MULTISPECIES: DUF4124 domain-containing protein [Methylotenera]|uniref:DUF4124 domain-containing protein n=1 Tax=Methylotenera TaxID=359407 RepID=UPI00035FE74D|nr:MULTISPECIES: DUF4124 domain-containing protein [Methylotenera]